MFVRRFLRAQHILVYGWRKQKSTLEETYGIFRRTCSSFLDERLGQVPFPGGYIL